LIFPWNILESFLAIFNNIFADAYASYLFGRESNTFEVNFLEILSLLVTKDLRFRPSKRSNSITSFLYEIGFMHLPNLPFQELLNQRNLGKA